MEFKKDCPNNICNTDLKVAAEARYVKHENFFVVGNPDLDLDITITKTGDPSYTSNIFVAFPKSVQFQNVKKIEGSSEVICGFLEDTEELEDGEEDTNSLEYLQRQLVPAKTEDELMMVCAFGNPLSNNSGVR